MMRVALLLVLLAGSALADHAYSHRYVFEGRLLGSDDLPLPGRAVAFLSEGEDFLEPCREGPQQSVTNEDGDFRFCYHHHAIEVGTLVGVQVGNVTALRPADVAFRRTNVVLHEPNETGVAPEGWNETYRVSGRAWRVGARELEGVPVYGEAVAELPVNLTVRDAQGGEQTYRATTDAYGDFDLVLETPGDPSALSLTLEAMGRPQPAALDARSHRSYAPIYVPTEGALSKTDAAPTPRELPAAPGSTVPRMEPLLVVAIVLALVAAIAVSRRKAR